MKKLPIIYIKKPTFHLFLLIFFFIISFTNIYSQSACVSGQVFINEIYTEGGLTGATYLNDYVELYNSSGSSCNLTNFSIQVATGNANNFPNVFAFPSGSIIPANGFFLIQFGSGGSAGIALPTPDFTASTDLSTSGKVALVPSPSSLTGNCASNLTNSIDFVGYCTTNCFKGAGAALSPTTTSSIERISNGFNTNNNNNDFTRRPASPRNTTAPTAASVSVSGVLRRNFLPVPYAVIQMTDQNGEIRLTRTNIFGHFKFNNVEIGQNYVFSVNSKSGTYLPVILAIKDDVFNLTFEFIN